MPEWVITRTEAPASLSASRREVDQLRYGPSRLLVARTAAGDVGVIRTAVREDRSDRGLITDLFAEEPYRSRGLPAALIHEAEKALRDLDVSRVAAVVLDGQKASVPFLEAGYIPFRLTVVLEWNLAKLLRFKKSDEITVEVAAHIDPQEIAEFIFHSYQPYWQWWKETSDEQPIGRAEYPVSESSDIRERQKAANWDRVMAALRQFNTSTPQRMVIVRKDGRIVGLCDAKVDPDDSMEWGVLISRDIGGRATGLALLGPALGWLHDQGLKTAQVTTTSGLDDYDPTVYLYVLVGGAQIKGEFLVLRKELA